VSATEDAAIRHAATRPGWYWWAAMLASSLLCALGAVLIALHVNAESDRKWCSVVETIDRSYREQPPTTPTGKKLAADMASLRRQLHCAAP
jgi:hypothetical protein